MDDAARNHKANVKLEEEGEENEMKKKRGNINVPTQTKGALVRSLQLRQINGIGGLRSKREREREREREKRRYIGWQHNNKKNRRDDTIQNEAKVNDFGGALPKQNKKYWTRKGSVIAGVHHHHHHKGKAFRFSCHWIRESSLGETTEFEFFFLFWNQKQRDIMVVPQFVTGHQQIGWFNWPNKKKERKPPFQ